MSDSLRALLDSTPLGAGNAPYIESLYEQFLADPQSVEPKWRDYFAGLAKAAGTTDVAHGPIRDALAKRAYSIGAPAAAAGAGAVSSDAAAKQGAVARLVQVYSNRGHLLADIDPLGLMNRPVPEVLELSHFGLSNADLETEFLTGSRIDAIPKRMKLKDIVAQLRQIYCGTIGAEISRTLSKISQPSVCGCRIASRKVGSRIATPPMRRRRSCVT